MIHRKILLLFWNEFSLQVQETNCLCNYFCFLFLLPSADLKLLEEATISVCKSLGEMLCHLFPMYFTRKTGKQHPCTNPCSLAFLYVALVRLKQCKVCVYVYPKPLFPLLTVLHDLIWLQGLKQIIPSLLCLFPFKLISKGKELEGERKGWYKCDQWCCEKVKGSCEDLPSFLTGGCCAADKSGKGSSMIIPHLGYYKCRINSI